MDILPPHLLWRPPRYPNAPAANLSKYEAYFCQILGTFHSWDTYLVDRKNSRTFKIFLEQTHIVQKTYIFISLPFLGGNFKAKRRLFNSFLRCNLYDHTFESAVILKNHKMCILLKIWRHVPRSNYLVLQRRMVRRFARWEGEGRDK